MFAALLLQVSQLVAPLELGAEPPETRAVAVIRYRRDVGGAVTRPATVATLPDFAGQARALQFKPTLELEGVVGTFSMSMLPRDVAARVFDGAPHLQSAVATSFDDPINESGGCRVFQRLERDAACRQIFLAKTDPEAATCANLILHELRAGADFAQIARERSDDKPSALRGGDLAIFERSANDALLREAAFKAKVGEIVGPIESPLGFHILQRVDVGAIDPRLRDDTWARARGILIAFTGAYQSSPDLEREQPDAQKLADDLAARIRCGEDMSALAAQWNDDRGGRERGGDLGWVRRNTTQMPQFFDKLFIEPPGSLIGPIPSNAGFVLLRREDPGPRSRFDLRKSAVVDLEQWVRSLGEQKDSRAAANEQVAAAVAACRKLSDALGSPLAWGMIEGELVQCANAADFVAKCAALPEKHTLVGGREIALRELSTAYAKALVELESYFHDEIWPAHERTIEIASASLREKLGPLGSAALDELMKDLGIADPKVVVPIYLVAEGPWPGAVTHRAPPNAACFVDADAVSGTLLVETVLHEATHALDLASSTQPSALNELRQRLDRADPAARDLPHTLMFLEAAAVVRRVFDPEHVDYGDAAGYYAKVPAATQLVRPAWTDFLAGKKTRAEALDAIAPPRAK